MGVLIQRVPFLGTHLLYAPRGPVCDLRDEAALRELKAGADALARKYRAYLFKMDPDVSAEDGEFLALARSMGFRRFTGGDGFETIQARFNYRLDLRGHTEETLLAHFTQKTRYNIRLAQKHGVRVRVESPERLDGFMRLMEVTGRRDGFAVRPKSYFVRMLTALGDRARLYMAYYQDRPVSGAVAVNFAGKTAYVYGASDNESRQVMPNYLVQWEMLRWALESGCTLYDFQGVSGNLDESNPLYGLYRFKKGFNGRLDELAGEFDYVYRPLTERLVDCAIDGREALLKLKRRLRG
jgi:lipid II:glycine glycyltransferase (peptidoglycan interpeptide bridge formation enzyme)